MSQRVLLILCAVLFCSAGAFTEDSTATASETVFESVPLLPNGDFEKPDSGTPAHPIGWQPNGENVSPGDAWQLDQETFLRGVASLKLSGGVSVVSDSVVLDADLTEINVTAMVKGAGGSARVCWMSREGSTVREDTLIPMPSAEPSGWTRCALQETKRPDKAERLVLVLSADSYAKESVWWDGVEMSASMERKPTAVILLNQVGYELFAPKRFVVSSNVQVPEGKFSVIAKEGKVAFEGTLGEGARIKGASDADWGRWFYGGDFTPLDDEGEFAIQVVLGGVTSESPSFNVSFDQLWNTTFDPVVRGFSSWRADNPDRASLWMDPGKPALSDAQHFWNLANLWSVLRWKIKLRPGSESIVEESMWAFPFAAKRQASASPEELPFWAAGLVRMAKTMEGDNSEVLKAGNAAVTALQKANITGPLAFSAAWDLSVITEDAAWKEFAKSLYPGMNLEAIDPLLQYESEVGGLATFDAVNALQPVADTLLKRAKNPFGVYGSEENGVPCYFLPSANDVPGAPDGVGNTYRVLLAAELMAKAYRFLAKPEYLAFIYDQLNWVLGCNPYGMCLMEGVGKSHPVNVVLPEGRTRESMAGMILNGIGPPGAKDDRPWLATGKEDIAAEATNGFALRNNARYMGALGQLKRIRTVQPEDERPR